MGSSRLPAIHYPRFIVHRPLKQKWPRPSAKVAAGVSKLWRIFLYVLSARVSPARFPQKEKRYVKANFANGDFIARFLSPSAST
jgi:hypothetical protein